MAEVKLLTEAEWRKVFIGHQFDLHEPMLRERGLIAPEPVDPLLIEAREICAKQAESNDLSGWAKECRAGKHDDDDEVECALAALRRGMELAPAASPLTREMVRDACRKAEAQWKTAEGEDGFIKHLHAALTEGQSK